MWVTNKSSSQRIDLVLVFSHQSSKGGSIAFLRPCDERLLPVSFDL